MSPTVVLSGAARRPKATMRQSVPTSGGSGRRRRVYRPYTETEISALQIGVAKHGAGKWKEILTDPTLPFLADGVRTAVDLKVRSTLRDPRLRDSESSFSRCGGQDKWRHLEVKQEKAEAAAARGGQGLAGGRKKRHSKGSPRRLARGSQQVVRPMGAEGLNRRGPPGGVLPAVSLALGSGLGLVGTASSRR